MGRCVVIIEKWNYEWTGTFLNMKKNISKNGFLPEKKLIYSQKGNISSCFFYQRKPMTFMFTLIWKKGLARSHKIFWSRGKMRQSAVIAVLNIFLKKNTAKMLTHTKNESLLCVEKKIKGPCCGSNSAITLQQLFLFSEEHNISQKKTFLMWQVRHMSGFLEVRV